jgi:hypothetical protein
MADWLHPPVGHRFPFIRVVQNLVIQWASLMPLTSGRIQSYSVAGLGRNMHSEVTNVPGGGRPTGILTPNFRGYQSIASLFLQSFPHCALK